MVDRSILLVSLDYVRRQRATRDTRKANSCRASTRNVGKNVGPVMKIQIADVRIWCASNPIHRPQCDIPTKAEIQGEVLAHLPLALDVSSIDPPSMGPYESVDPLCAVGNSQQK